MPFFHLTSFAIATLSLIPFTAGQFQLDYPPARGYNQSTLAIFPCGGQDAVSSNRTLFPMLGGAVQLNMQDDRAEVEILLGIGDDVGVNFTFVAVPIFQEIGMGQFCIDIMDLPDDLNIQEGQDATIQVVTSGDQSGGLYNCADIVFSSTAPIGPCSNGTGVTATAYSGPNKNANETDTSNAAPSAIGSLPSAPQSRGAAEKLQLGSRGVLVGSLLMNALW